MYKEHWEHCTLPGRNLKMPDKEQIIIDGVDVSECEFYNPYYCGMYIDGYGDSEGVCSDYEDCYYKQLARKTQECEELKEKIKQVKDFKDKVINQLKEENEVLKKQVVRCSEGWGKADCEKNWYQQAVQAKQEENHDLTMKLYEYRKALEPFQDEYFKGLDSTAIAEFAKKSIRLTTENIKLETAPEEIEGLIQSTLDDFEEDDEEVQLSYCHNISLQILDIISKAKENK